MLLIICFLVSFSALAQTGGLKGQVTDGSTPIPSVNVFLPDLKIGTGSDDEGYFRITNIPAGEYILRFSSVGFITVNEKVKILPNMITEVNVVMKTVPIEVGVVEVTGINKQEKSDTRTSVIDLDPRSAKILPGAGEDVLRTLQALPGVLAPSDFSSQLIIRGSGPDQNLIIMDDVEIFNPYRLYGLISMFNPEAVSDINLITGGFPAKYGDRLSAVLDVTNREGTLKNYLSGNINASIIEANLVLEGKNPFNLPGSWLFNSRRTYYDLIVEPFVKDAGLVDDDVTFPNFYDLQGKIALGPFKGHKIFFNGVLSRDGVDVISSNERSNPDSISVFNDTRNDVFSLGWHYLASKKIFNKLIVSWYSNRGATDFDSKILDPSLNRDLFEDIIPDTLSPYLLGFTFNNTFEFKKYSVDDKLTLSWNDHVFEAGAGADIMETTINFEFNLDPQLRAIINSNPQARAVLDNFKDIKKYNRYRAFIQNNFKVNDRLYIQPGIRTDYYNILNKVYIAPRLSLSYSLDPLTTMRFVTGLYYQSPGYEKLRDQNVLLNLDTRYTYQLAAEKAVHYVLAFDRWLSTDWNLRVEGYYKDFTNLISTRVLQGSRYFTEAIPGKDPVYPSGWTNPVTIRGDSLTQIPVNSSFGEAYGIEFFLARTSLSDDLKLNGWISYSLALAEIFEDGKKYPFRFDQRNTINIVLNYQLNNWLEVGTRWQFGSGFPVTNPIGIKPRIILIDTNFDGIPDSPEIATRASSSNPDAERKVIFDIDYGNHKLNGRKPAYHRLDIRFTAYTKFWGLDWSFYLDVINAYNRSNIIAYNYYINPDLSVGRKANKMFPVIPTLGFSMKF